MPDVVQGVRRVWPRSSFLLTALPGKFRQCGCAGWGLSLVWSCAPKAPELGCAPCPELREWEEKAAPTLPFHPTGYTPEVMISQTKCMPLLDMG